MRNLYLGVDECRHFNPFSLVVVGVFSFDENDIRIDYKRSRKIILQEKLIRYFYKNRNFRCVSFTHHSEENHFITAIPLLLDYFLPQLSEKSNITIYIDGNFNRELSSKLESCISDKVNKIEQIRGFPKIRGWMLDITANHKSWFRDGSYRYPKILSAADSLAYHLSRDTEFRERMDFYEKNIFLSS